jgi:hypothetical protein
MSDEVKAKIAEGTRRSMAERKVIVTWVLLDIDIFQNDTVEMAYSLF